MTISPRFVCGFDMANKKSTTSSRLTLVVADQMYGSPELRDALGSLELGSRFELVTGEKGIDSMLEATFRYSLFGNDDPKLVIAETAPERDAVIGSLSKTHPQTDIVLVIRSATPNQKKKYETLGFSVIELPALGSKGEKDSGEAFSLAYLIVLGDAKNSWTMWKDMESRRVAVDSVIPAIWWQFKKSFGFTRGKEEKEKLLNLMKKIVDTVHESRKGISSLSRLFEQMLLSLRK